MTLSSKSREMSETLSRRTFLVARKIDPAGPYQLPIWPDTHRALPNEYARSALFTIRNRNTRRASLENMPLFQAHKNIQLSYTGVELRAEDDELVWLQIIDYAKRSALDSPIHFGVRQLCSDLGWPLNGAYYTKARACIARLKATNVTVTYVDRGFGCGVSLIRDYRWDGDNERNATRYTCWIHPDLIFLFAGNTYTKVEWVVYRSLTPIARRLFDYAASHGEPWPLSLSTFHNLCASTTKAPAKWTQLVRAACLELKAAGLLKHAIVSDGRIAFDR